MAATDYLGLGSHKIFEVLRQTLPKDIQQTRNILCVKDDVLYSWNYQDKCVLTLNIKAVKTRGVDGVPYQTLLPNRTPLFEVNRLVANEHNTLLAVAGLNGLMVLSLPDRYPPYGTFGGNKEVVYCRSHLMHERLLEYGKDIEVRQIRFHPGNLKQNNLILLTSDNTIRLCTITDEGTSTLKIFKIGPPPSGKFPASHRYFLEEAGDTAVDFDFGPPEKKALEGGALRKTPDKLLEISKQELQWPAYVLFGNGTVYTVNMPLEVSDVVEPRGPLPMFPEPECIFGKDYCSILCIPSTPPVLCVANCNGTISHCVVLPIEEPKTPPQTKFPYQYHAPNKEIHVFETLEIELGLSTENDCSTEYSCPVFLHKDRLNVGNYLATHEAGVHSISVNCIEDLHTFVDYEGEDDGRAEDIFKQTSNAEYLLCTKMNANEPNLIAGVALYHEPTSILTLLGNGQFVSLALISLPLLPSAEEMAKEHLEDMNFPLKKMLSNPFDVHIQSILRKIGPNPILKLAQSGEYSQKDGRDLLQRAAQIFHEHFKQIDKVREEFDKRVKALKMICEFQTDQIRRMMEERQALQQTAGDLAERYEDIKDKQEDLTKRCERLLLHLSRKQTEPSDAEKKFLNDLKLAHEKLKKYKKAINTLVNKHKYQEVQMTNWKSHERKQKVLDEVQTNTIKASLQDTTNKISYIVQEVNQFKEQLNLE